MITILLLALVLTFTEPSACHTTAMPLIAAEPAEIHGVTVPFPIDGAAVKFTCSF